MKNISLNSSLVPHTIHGRRLGFSLIHLTIGPDELHSKRWVGFPESTQYKYYRSV
jgi:hypothetical protein